jgi:hypothetical protein
MPSEKSINGISLDMLVLKLVRAMKFEDADIVAEKAAEKEV